MKIIIKKLLENCESRECDGCIFQDICDLINSKLGPHEWSKNDYNKFCELIMREDEENDKQ